jgi:hypothetical protein
MDDYFDLVWDGLPTENGLLAHRLLLWLAVLQEPASDALLAELVDEPADLVETALAQLGKWLSVREQEGQPRYRIFHNLFVDYVVGTMRPSEVRSRHAAAAAHFRDRWQEESRPETFRADRLVPDEVLLYALTHLPLHEVEARLWDAVYETLTDFRFLETKATHVAVTETDGTRQYGGVYALQDDLRRALAAMP